jgi:hypothetical protein
MPHLATQHLRHWLWILILVTLFGCASPLKQPPTQRTIRKPYKEVALKVHAYYLSGGHYSGSNVTFTPPAGVHAFSNLRRVDFVLSEGMRKTWTHDTLVSLIQDREADAGVRVEVRSIRNDGGLFGMSKHRVIDVEQKRLEEVLSLFAE